MAEGFPVVHELNDIRFQLFEDSTRYGATTTSKVCSWLGHKAVTVIALPVNIAAIGASLAGTALSACTLGAFKVAVFACTLGGLKLEFSTGCLYLLECGFHSTVAVAMNVGEVLVSAADLIENGIEQGRRFVVWIGEITGLEYIVGRIFERITAFFYFIGERISQGFEKAAQMEPNDSFAALPEPLHFLNHRLSGSWDDLHGNEPSLGWMAQHAVVSTIALPINGVAAIVGIAAAILSSTAFVTKAILYAATNINVPIPTYAGRMIGVTCISIYECGKDVGALIGDGGLLLYKTSRALGITRVAVLAFEILAYIPKAIFS